MTNNDGSSVLLNKPGSAPTVAELPDPDNPEITYPHQAVYSWAVDGTDTATPTDPGPDNKFDWRITFADGTKITFPNVPWADKPTIAINKVAVPT